MDPHRLPNTLFNVVDGQNDDNNNNQIQANTQIPAVEPFVSQTSADSQAQPQEPSDIYGEMPELQDVSDSESESDNDAADSQTQSQEPSNTHIDYDEMPELHEVSDSDSDSDIDEMQSVDSDDDDDEWIDDDTDSSAPPRPSLSSNTQSTRRRLSNTRRARLEDDEHNRRHPFQRAAHPTNVAPFPPGQTQRQTPPIHHHIFHRLGGNGDNNHPFRFFQHLMPNNNDNNNNTGNPPSQNDANPGTVNNDNNNATPSAPQPQQHHGNDRDLWEGIFRSVRFGRQPLRAGLDLDGDTVDLGIFGPGLGMLHKKEDPERAKKLIDGLEVVPVGLVRRLERVGGTGGGMGEDISNGGDAGCAICWDKLLDGDGNGFGKEEGAATNEGHKKEGSSPESETKHPKVVSLPCAHVFHADCLTPWFSKPRHTTCPTCRFNIDPNNLTYSSARRRQREPAEEPQPANATNAPAGAGAAPGNYIRHPHALSLAAHRWRAPPPFPFIPGPQVLPTGFFVGPQVTVRDLPRGFFQRQAANPEPTPGAAAGGHDNHNPTNQLNSDAPLNQLPPGFPADMMRVTLDMVVNGLTAAPASTAQPPSATQGPAATANTTGDGDLHWMRDLGEIMELFVAGEQEEQAYRQADDDDNAGGDTNPAQPQPTQTAALPPQQQFFNSPPFLAGSNASPGIAVATDSARTLHETFSQLLAGLRPPQQQQTPAGQPQPQPEAHGQQDTPQPQEQQVPPAAATLPPIPNLDMLGFVDVISADFLDPERSKRTWAPPPAPGPTLRQRVERREREAGLRCCDVSCGIGPSDEDPFGTGTETGLGETTSSMKQLAIKSKEDPRSELCAHTFHNTCLVSAGRVALRGADALVEDGQVEVPCPVCRGVGCVSKEEWDEGVLALA